MVGNLKPGVDTIHVDREDEIPDKPDYSAYILRAAERLQLLVGSRRQNCRSSR